MSIPAPRRSPAAGTCTLLLVALPLVSFPPMLPSARAHGLAAAPASEGFDALMVEAEGRRADGAYAESAALYARAYRARPEAERVDQIGEITVRNAITDYDLAVTDPPDRELLEAQAELLDEFLTAREQARLAAKSKKSKKALELPQDLVDELARMEARLAELREADRSAAEAAAQLDPIEPASTREPAPARKPSAKQDLAILGIGVASFVGGVALVGGSAWNFARITERGNARVAALDADPQYTPEQRTAYDAELDDWRHRWRSISTGLMVGGVALATAGIGLSSWALVRMRKQRSTPSAARVRVAPALAREHVGGVLTIGF